MSLQAYQTAQNVTESPRQTEYRLFAMVTGALRETAGQAGKEMFEAVNWNRRLWLTLQADLSSEENQYPDDLKAKLISLALWVDRHSAAVLRGQQTVDALINVNRAIMDGLSGNVEETRLAS